MLKGKKFFLGVAVLLSASLFLAGCGDAAEAGAAGPAGSMPVSGLIDVDVLQALVTAAAEDGEKIRLVGVTIDNGGYLDLGSASVQILGSLNTGTTVVNAVKATVAFGENAAILGSGTLLGAAKFADANVAGTVKVAALETALPATPPPSGIIALEDLSLTNIAGDDVVSGLTVYVLKKLTVGDNTASALPAGTVVAVGTVEVTGTNTTVFTVPTKVNYSDAVITVGAAVSAPVEVTFAATAMGKAQFNVPNLKTLKVLGATTVGATATAPVSVTGTGTLELAAGVTIANITGDGKVVFTQTADFVNVGQVFTNTVKADTITFTAGFSTSQYAAVTLDGDVILPATTGVVTFKNVAGIVTLNGGSSVAAGNRKVLSVEADTVLTAGLANATLTATANTLTVAAQALTIGTANVGEKITVGTGAILAANSVGVTIDQGTLVLAGTGTDAGTITGTTFITSNDAVVDVANLVNLGLAIASADTAKITAITLSGDVTLSATATIPADVTVTVAPGVTVAMGANDITLTTTAALKLVAAAGTGGAKITGTGKVTAGTAEVVGGTGGWQAVGSGTVAIAGLDAATAQIEASAATAVLTAGTGATITQNNGASNNLTIAANTTIDLKGTIATAASVGAISLKEDGTSAQGGKLTFTDGTSIVKIGSETDAAAALNGDGGVFSATETINKLTVSAYADVLIYPGATTAGKVNTIKGGTSEGSLQAFGGASGSGTTTINAATAATT